MGNKTVLSLSGGLDSAVLLYHLQNQGDEVLALNFSYGSRHNVRERRAAAELCRATGTSLIEADLPFIGQLYQSSLLNQEQELPRGEYSEDSLKKTVVPGRNTILMSIAIGLAESHNASRVAIANHANDHGTYPDTRPEWVAAMSLVAWHGTYQRVQLYAPFTHLQKSEICLRGKDLGVPFAKTWTCYDGRSRQCGTCSACRLRQEAFRTAGIEDPTSYEYP